MVSNIKKVIIPIKDIDLFSVTTDGASVYQLPRCNVTLRYRIKSPDGTRESEWSPIYDLQFVDPIFGTDLGTLSIAEINGYKIPSTSRATPISSYQYGDPTDAMMQSGVERVTTQSDASASPDVDLFKYSWIVPPTLSVKNFDVFLSWFSVNYVIAGATLSAASASPYTGTITFTGTGAQNAANTVRSYYNRMNAEGTDLARLTMSSNITTTGALAAGGGAPGQYFTIVSGASTDGTGAAFNIKSSQTWTAGTVKHIFKLGAYTDFEYAATTSSNDFSFKRTGSSNKVTATIDSGSSTISLDQDVLYSGLCVGMKVRKVSGDGEFGVNATISAIDYINSIITLSTNAFGTTSVPHTASGYVEFVADNTDLTITIATGITQTVQWNMPTFVQPMLHASNLSRDYVSTYSLLSVAKPFSVYYGGFGVLSGATTSAPFTANIIRMPFGISSQTIDYGKRIYATNSGGSMGGGMVTYGDYIDSTTIAVSSSTALTNGIITNIRF